MPEWTGDQRRVIGSKARDLICSAAAGSGKTAVLVERILRMISEGEDPESFLIMTFTNAAASEMKEKIRQGMIRRRDVAQIRSALDRIDLMQISTIHSFCQRLLRSEFQAAGIDPMFRICDSAQQERLFHEAFLEACNQLAAEEDGDYLDWKRKYELNASEKLVHAMHVFLMSLPNPEAWLNEKTEWVPTRLDEDHPWWDTICRLTQEKLDEAGLILNREYRMFGEEFALEAYRESWKKDTELFHVKQSWLSRPEGRPEKSGFSSLKAVRGLTPPESDWKERYQRLRKEFKDVIAEADELIMADREKTLAEWREMRSSMRGLRTLVLRTGALFRESKRNRGLADFSDLEQDAMRVLTDSAAREEVRDSWRHIFVDECQDISTVQDAIIQALHSDKNDLFMVGDVKQSIYRFRLANPTLFMDRIHAFLGAEDPDKECVYLQANFRSRPEILETANLIFRKIMRADVTEMDYTSRDELVAGRETEGFEPVCVDVLCGEEDDKPDLSAVADHLTLCMRDLMNCPAPGKDRNYAWRDFVILMPAVSVDGPKLAELLRLRDVPVFFDGDGEYYQLPEILTFREMLEWIENPLQDIPLITALKNVPFLFTDEELSRVRLKNPAKGVPFHEAFAECAREDTDFGTRCAAVLEKWGEWQMMSRGLKLPDFLWYFYQETGYYDVFAADPNGAVTQANLRVLVDQALRAEQAGMLTLREFLAFMRDRQQGGDQRSAALLGEKDNLVRIMTIHKSKGLQFPVVFCAGLDRPPEGREQAGVRMHHRLGFCLPFKDPAHRISRPTLADRVFRARQSWEERAEKVRLLYVALTRAQERLFLVTCKQADPLWSMPDCPQRVAGAKTYIDWVMPPLLDEKQSTGYTQSSTPWKIRTFDVNQQRIVEKKKDIHNLKFWLDTVLSAPPVDDLWKKPQAEDDRSPIRKRSVTSLIREARRGLEENEEETPETKRVPEVMARRLSRGDIPEVPAFLLESGKGGGAWRGTLTHRVLSLLNLDLLRDASSPAEVIRGEMRRLTEERVLTSAEAEQVPEEELTRFWSSPLGRRILRAEEVRREWNFNLYLPGDSPMILQGVIDCAFREGDGWVVLDYKTDRIRDEAAFTEEYRPQMAWYAEALSRLTGLPVRERILYSLSLGKAFPLTPDS